MLIKFTKTILVLSWLAYIFLLSSIPGQSFGEPVVSWQGTLAHLILYAILAYLLVEMVLSWQEIRSINWWLVLVIVIFCWLYGISDEYHQAFVPGRFVSLLDLSFNGLGAFTGAVIFKYKNFWSKPKLLLHLCCAVCGAYLIELLKPGHELTLYFYNPNIYTIEEYQKRLAEVKKIAGYYNLKLIIGEYHHQQWLKNIKGHEKDPERGERCLICYQARLEKVAELAKDQSFKNFTSSLIISPHKDAEAIGQIATKLAGQSGLKFLDQNFNQSTIYKQSLKLAKKLNLYRQNYCGCEFSIKKPTPLK